MTWRVGVDIGGTFTDLVAVDQDGKKVLWKEDTTPDGLERAVERGLEKIAAEVGVNLTEFLTNVDLFVHGSTVATNTLIQRNGPRTALICTEGFRDVLYFRDGFKWARFDPHLPRPPDLVPRYLRVGVKERVAYDGRVLTKLGDDALDQVVRVIQQHEVEAVAVALLWAHVNSSHERRIRDLLNQLMPNVPVVLSSDVLPELGEWVRTSATVLSAYVYPRASRYLGRLENWLANAGLSKPMLVMQINGGSATVERSLRVPVNMVASGPAAAPGAARYLGQQRNARDIISIDMGGTSLDVCLIRNGDIPLSRDLMTDFHPLGVPGVEIHSIGAGGGSIAWIDSGGALRIGPDSAGATPGPAAYDRGGWRPTVTDANVVLGYLSPTAFLGGRRALREDLAEQAIDEHIARPLGISAVEAAAGIVRLVDENMVGAIRAVSVERGIDPRSYLVVGGGGAGPLHVARLSQELGITKILVPAEAGTLSAYGMTVTDVRHDHATAFFASSESLDLEEIRAALTALEEKAVEGLRESSFSAAAIRLERSVDARYAGQVHELITPVPNGPFTSDLLDLLTEAFHSLHLERYGYALIDTPIEFLHWRVAGIGLITNDRPSPSPTELPARVGVPRETRGVYCYGQNGFRQTPIFWGKSLTKGSVVQGPAVIESDTTTIVVPQRWSAQAGGGGEYALELTDAADGEH